MIVLGFPGIGKSHVCVVNSIIGSQRHWHDTDSSTYPKDETWPGSYVDDLIEKSERNDDIVLASTHDEVRQELIKRGVPYVLVHPSRDCKEEYMLRYHERGSEEAFKDLLREKWDEWIKTLENDVAAVRIVLKSSMFLSDVESMISLIKISNK